MSDDLIERFSIDSTDAINALNQAKKAADGVTDSMGNSEQAARGFTSSLADAEKESRRLEKTINQQEKLTNEWRQELVRVEAAQKKVGRGTQEYFKLQKAQKDLNRAIEENVKDIKGLRIDKKITDGNVRDLKKQEAQLKKNNKETDRAAKKTSAFGKVAQKVGRLLVAAFAVDRIIAGVRAAVRTISEYQSAVSELGGISGATDEQLQSLTRTARDFAKASQFTATQVVKAQTELAKLGRSVEEIEQTTEAVLLLATAAGTDVPNAAEVAAQTMNQFGIATEDAGKVVDIMSKSFTSSSLNIQRFQGAFKAVGTTANVVGASLEETTASISALVDAGIPAEKAGTDLRNIYIALAEKGLTWNEAQEMLVNSTDKLVTATDLFGQRSGAAGVILAQQSGKIADLTKAYENAEGAAQDLADAQLDNLKGDQLLLTSAWEEFILSVEDGTSLVGTYLRNLSKNAATFVREITLLGNEQGKLAQQIQKDEELILRLRKDGNDSMAERIEQRLELRKGQLEELRLEKLTFEAKDDILIKEELSNAAVQERIELLKAEASRLKIIFGDKDDIVDTDVRILFLQGDITKAQRDSLLALNGTLEQRRKLLAQIEKENAEHGETKKLTEEELEAQREASAARIELRVLEQQRNNTIINDNLKAEKESLEAANEAAKESGSKNIRQIAKNNKRIEELNREILKSDLKLAEVREQAKREEIELLNSIQNKTPEIRAQIFAAEEDLVSLSRAVDDIFFKLANGSVNFALNANLSEDIDFSQGIGDIPLEEIEEPLLGMHERMQQSWEDYAAEVVRIRQELMAKGIDSQTAYEMAVGESENRMLQMRAASAAAMLSTVGNVFGQIAGLMSDSAENSKELALFEILTNTAAGVASAVAAGAGAGPPPANIIAIGAGIGAVLAGIAQAKQVLSASSKPNFSTPSFIGGGDTPGTRRSGGVDGKGGQYVIVHPNETIIDHRNPEIGLKALSQHPELDGWVNRYYGASRLSHAVTNNYTTTTTESNWSDRRMVRAINNTAELQAATVQELRKLGKRSKFKRAG